MGSCRAGIHKRGCEEKEQNEPGNHLFVLGLLHSPFCIAATSCQGTGSRSQGTLLSAQRMCVPAFGTNAICRRQIQPAPDAADAPSPAPTSQSCHCEASPQTGRGNPFPLIIVHLIVSKNMKRWHTCRRPYFLFAQKVSKDAPEGRAVRGGRDFFVICEAALRK